MVVINKPRVRFNIPLSFLNEKGFIQSELPNKTPKHQANMYGSVKII